MPPIDIKYSKNVVLNSQKILQAIEVLINRMDSSAGACKSRAYVAKEYLHTHCYLRVALLKKPHRDKEFMKRCLSKLTERLESVVPKQCYYSVELFFASDYYATHLK